MSLRTKFVLIFSLTLLLVTGLISGLTVFTIRKDSQDFVRDLNSQAIRLISQSLAESVNESVSRAMLWYEISQRNVGPVAAPAEALQPGSGGGMSPLKGADQRLIALYAFSIASAAPAGTRSPDSATSMNLIYQWENRELLSAKGLSRDQLISWNQREAVTNRFLNAAKDRSFKGRFMVLNATVSDDLPSLALVIPYPDPDHVEQVIVAEVGSEALLKRYQEPMRYRLYLLDSNFNILIHSNRYRPKDEIAYKNLEIVEKLQQADPDRIYMSEFKSEALGGVPGEEVFGAYVRLGFGGLNLVVEVPKRVMVESERRLEIQALIVAGFVLIWALVMMVLFTTSMVRPIEKLATLTKDIAKGVFNRKVLLKRDDELGMLAKSFNAMCEELGRRETALDEAKKKLIQSEKMSAFGQMSAGIAHEVKNPLAGILGYAQLSKKKIEPNSPIANYLDIIEQETLRCKDIVENLMKFARQEKAVFSKIDINKTAQNAIRLVEHQMGVNGISIVKGFASEGSSVYVSGNANQLQQVLMNLMLNAQHAMPSGGTLTVTTHLNDKLQEVMIVVSDTGCGMSDEVQQRIFEPFFTTKGDGKGTGLGLSVSYGIIKDHHGMILVDSEVGKGSSFTITLPLSTADEAEVPQPLEPAGGLGSQSAKGAA